MQNYNVILDTDSYKLSHYLQYPFREGYVSSYVESRGGRYDKTVFAGLQILLKNWENNPITYDMIDEAEDYVVKHGLPFNREGWEIIVEDHDGKLPVMVEAVPEGTVVDTKNVLLQICNTDPRLYWLPSYLETAVLRAVWYPTTVATISKGCMDVIKTFHKKTVGNLDAAKFSLHDFGSRGVSARESAGIGGVAHLFNAMGTDTVEALAFAREYYSADMAGFSVPASEHSTATAWGPMREVEYARHMLETFDTPLISVVSDSYDIFNMVENVWCGELLEEVKASGKKIVIRPDSGDPEAVLERLFNIFEAKLDYTVNDLGYKVLPDYFGVLQGDGVNEESIGGILELLEMKGWAASNIVFGMGGELLQNMTRDTQKFAMKASAYNLDNPAVLEQWVPISKDPVSDRGKKSKQGLLTLVIKDGNYQTIPKGNPYDPLVNKLRRVFLNGDVVRTYSLDRIRDWIDEQ